MIFDGHSDILTNVANRRKKGETNIFKKYHLEPFRESDIRGGILVVWVEPIYQKMPLERSNEIIKYALEEFNENQDIINLVKKHSDIEKGLNEGKINIMIGMEGLSQIKNDESYIDYIYDEIGARHAMLTWNELDNNLASCWKKDPNEGLTDLGKSVVKKMQTRGMILDVSHLNDGGFWDIMRMTNQPIIASHSNSRKLMNHKRNLSDDMIKEIGKTGGVIGVNAYREFVGADKSSQKLKNLADHFEYIADLIGIDHVGFGFDFTDFLDSSDTGFPNLTGDTDCIDGLNSHKEAKKFVEELKNRGFKNEELEKATFKNFDRVIKEILK